MAYTTACTTVQAVIHTVFFITVFFYSYKVQYVVDRRTLMTWEWSRWLYELLFPSTPKAS